MPTNTPVLALPYPLPADTVDVPRDVQALATKLDGISALRPPVVTTLPGSPVDGDEVYFLADATNGFIWHLRYRAASASAHKWELIGGSPWLAVVQPAESTASTTLTDLATVGPSLTLTRAGAYLVHFGAEVFNSAHPAEQFVAIVATPPITGPALGGSGAGALFSNAVSSTWAITVVAGTVIKLQYRVSSGTGSFQSRFLTALPRQLS